MRAGDVTTARIREGAIFIRPISVWDTTGTLGELYIEIIMLFPLAVRRVMGCKAPRQAPGVPRYVHAERVPLHPNVSRRSAPSSDNQMSLLGNSGRRAAIPGFFPVCKTGVVTPWV